MSMIEKKRGRGVERKLVSGEDGDIVAGVE
jgi:hypothetical protein